jgi:hypothetical protein
MGTNGNVSIYLDKPVYPFSRTVGEVDGEADAKPLGWGE